MKAVEVDVYEGDHLLARSKAAERRKDLANYLGDSDHAFVVYTPPALKDGREHHLRVIIAGTDFELNQSPCSLAAAAPSK